MKKQFNMDIEQLINEGLQHTSAITVIFTKADGSTRIMDCTLNFALIPAEFHPKTQRSKEDGTYRVFDVEKKGWRSFHIDSVESVITAMSWRLPAKVTDIDAS